MPESETHRRAKKAAAGKGGKTEVHLKSGRRLDAATRTRAIEVETSGRDGRLRQAAQRLKASGKPGRTLVVPQRDFAKARNAMRSARVGGTVRNLTGTRSSRVSPSRSSGKGTSSRRK